jgi:nitrogen regulatory protein PII-like uncharacterized protein
MNSELERVSQKAVVLCFVVPEELRKSTKKLSREFLTGVGPDMN